MAIVYAPPDALDAETLAGAARSDVQARQAELAIRGFAAGAGATNDFFRTAVASGAQRADAGNMQAQLEQRQYEFGEQVRQRDRLAQLESQTRLAEIDRRGEVQAFLQTMDPGYAEQKQYEADTTAISRIMADPTIAPFEKEARIAEMMPGVKMIRQRLEMARAKQQEELARREFEQADRIAKITDMQGKFLTKSLPERTVPLPDGGGWLVETQAGKWEHVAPPKVEKPKPMTGTEMRAEADVAYPEDAQSEQGRPIRSPEQQQRFNEYLGKIWEREKAKQAGAEGGAVAPGGAVVPQAQVYDQRPFADGKPTTDYQRDQFDAAAAYRKAADKLPGDVGRYFKAKAVMLADIIKRGTPSAERELYDALVNELERMPPPPVPAGDEPPAGESAFKQSLRRPLVPGR